MEWRHVESNDFMVPTGQDGFEVIPPLTEGWFQWRVRGFEDDGLPGNYSCTSEKEILANFNADTRVPPLKESKVPRDYLGEGSSCSSPREGFLLDCRMRTSDELFNDLPDFEIQTSMQNMDDIFLDSYPVQDLMHLENPYESIHIPDSTHSPWNWRISMLEDSDTLMNDVSREEDDLIEDPNFESHHIIDPIPTPESFITSAADEPMCMEATVLKELENVMLQLNIETRICIRDALYRLAKSSKEQHNFNLCESGSFMDLPSYSEFSRGTSRQELSGSHEQKTNVIDRAIAALMFDRPDYRISEFPSSEAFSNNKESAAASVS
ncbi:uncharacterized protein LOC110114152 [Dendrobium catenatum]|uniref:uncharacterized protein LOC110114152 n=1 Tax=Dendrobium catenatum TaxID=906689 RepID=UPI0009F67F64|nr:uncharacterized protein LOC110114152 [Dendrobium catenatum]